jgi:cytidylate kinase
MAAESMSDRPEDLSLPLPQQQRESPRHGFRGNRRRPPDTDAVPASLTIAISREAGSRGSSIAARAGQKLGWQIFNQEVLEYIAQEGAFRQDIVENLSPAAGRWAEEQLQRLLREQNLSQHPSIIDMARIILALGAQGEVILVGRGAGCILPAESTLHVRTIAPLPDRVAYFGQWLRLTEEEAAEQVRVRDQRRSDFIAAHFHRQPTDVNQYDLVLNTSLLGEDLCADLIAHAARSKLSALQAAREAPGVAGSPDPGA